MSLTWARLTLRLSRFELLAFGGFVALFIVATVLTAASIDSVRPPAECLVNREAPTLACDLKSNAWYQAQNGVAGLSMGLLVFLSFAAGLFLGVPIVARELERGTARLAWSLAPSRMRWFLARMLPVLVLLAIVTFVAGIAADRYVASTTAETDLSNSFTAFGYRGLLIASRAVFIFAVGVAVGSIVARALPAVILAAVIATIGLAGGERVYQMILASEAVAIPMDPNNNNPRQGDLYIDQKFVLPDGTLVDYSYFGGADPYDEFGMPKYPVVMLVVPGERYRFVETREALALAGGSLVALVLAGFVVSRRRPG
jgi:ABC-type transport system involved in multi-copper enzyme maturation permease subunit